MMLKDSLEMRGEDREEILKKCIHCPENRVVVTHGTDTMVETARVLGRNVEGKTVVLVGRHHSLCLGRLRRIVQPGLRIFRRSGTSTGRLYHNEWKDIPVG